MLLLSTKYNISETLFFHQSLPNGIYLAQTFEAKTVLLYSKSVY